MYNNYKLLVAPNGVCAHTLADLDAGRDNENIGYKINN